MSTEDEDDFLALLLTFEGVVRFLEDGEVFANH